MPEPLVVASVPATPAGFLLLLAVALPAAGAALAPLLGARWAERAMLLILPAGVSVAVAAALATYQSGSALVHHLGGWGPPLGIALRADGVSVAMLVTTAVVIGATVLFARAEFGAARVPSTGRHAPLAFWTLLPALWAAINGVLVGSDLFSLYVALELTTLAAVPLVCIDGRAEATAAALRYLLFALLGSVPYLIGVALLYGACGTLDVVLLSGRVRAEPATVAAAALMTAGLLAKTALFPLHLWLPSAHGGAPAAVSALLSALVVKASFFLLLRLWFAATPGLLGGAVAQLLAALGAAAILAGSVVALRQSGLKMLVAYSTVAQVGYLFLMIPLVVADPAVGGPPGAGAWLGGVLQAVSHAFAKAAMAMAAGLMAQALGHDRVADLGAAGRAAPTSVLVFGLAGLSLMGIPPSGGFTAKWLLLQGAISTGQWWWAVVIVVGGLLTGGYVYRVLAGSLAGGGPAAVPAPAAEVAYGGQAVALALALISVGIGFVPLASFGLVQIGRPGFVSGASAP